MILAAVTSFLTPVLTRLRGQAGIRGDNSSWVNQISKAKRYFYGFDDGKKAYRDELGIGTIPQADPDARSYVIYTMTIWL